MREGNIQPTNQKQDKNTINQSDSKTNTKHICTTYQSETR